MSLIKPPREIVGNIVRLRDVQVTDAEFILALRTDPIKCRFLHATSASLEDQVRYIEAYKAKSNEWYFVVEALDATPLGCIRIYDVRGDSFCIGSWLMKNGAPEMAALECTILCYRYGFEVLGFASCHFEVRKQNTKVVKFHKMYGARVVGETPLDLLFEFDRSEYASMAVRFSSLI